MLNSPRGIFVNTKFNLYVADSGNNRIQLFQYGHFNATTTLGTGAPGTISLDWPLAVVLDADGYLFIADRDHHRIVGANPYGFRCIVGCTGINGTASNQLNSPRSLAFDSYGNIFVADRDNHRVQKFLLATNFCRK